MATLARSNTAADGELASIFGLQHHNMHATSAHHATGTAADCLVQNNCMSSMQEESFYRESRYPFTLSSQSSFDNNCGSTSENAMMLLGNKSNKVMVVQDPHPLHHHAYSSSQGGGGSPSPGALTQGSGSPFELLRAISPFTPAALIRSDREPIFGDSIQQASSPDGLDGLLRTMQQQQAGGLEHLTVGFDTPSQHFDHDTPPPPPPSSWTNDHMGGVGFQGRESDVYHPGSVVHQEPTALQQNGSWMVPDGSNGWLCANWNASSSGGGAQNHNSVTTLQQQQQQQQHNCGLEEEDGNADSGRGMIPEQSPSSMGATGLQLVHLLLACAEAVANEQVSLAHVILVRLSSLVVQRGNTMQRLAAVFMDALAARVMKATDSGPYRGLAGDISVPISDMLEAYSVLYESTPLGKFAHLTCNQILLDAVERENCIHVLDLDIWHGMQWPAFLQVKEIYRLSNPPSTHGFKPQLVHLSPSLSLPTSCTILALIVDDLPLPGLNMSFLFMNPGLNSCPYSSKVLFLLFFPFGSSVNKAFSMKILVCNKRVSQMVTRQDMR
jgi:hypothetical protein